MTIEQFCEFEFYLEICLNDSEHGEVPKYLTICRTVRNPSKVSFKRHTLPNQDFLGLVPEEWSAYQLGLNEARSYLEGLLGLKFIKGYSYRKFLAYLLRVPVRFYRCIQIKQK